MEWLKREVAARQRFLPWFQVHDQVVGHRGRRFLLGNAARGVTRAGAGRLRGWPHRVREGGGDWSTHRKV